MALLGNHLRPPPPGCRRGRSAFSLVEAMVAAGIVGVMLVASLNLLSSAARTRSTDNNRRTAVLLAQQLLGEVLQQPYKDEGLVALGLGPELGEDTRAKFDDVDDYKNYNEKPLTDRNGNTLPGFENWKRFVKVTWVSPDDLSEVGSDSGLLMVEVRVTIPKGQTVSLFALRSANSVPADAPPAGSTTLQWTGIEIDTGGDTPHHAYTGANAVSQPRVN